MKEEKYEPTALEIVRDNPRSYDELFAMRERDLGYGLPLGVEVEEDDEEE